MAVPVAIFVRVSTKAQDYERQVSDLTAYAGRHQLLVVDTISEVISASRTRKEHRPGLTKLLALARAGQIRKVLVWDISRLGRRPSEVLYIIEELAELGVSLFVHNYGLETLNPNGKRNPAASLVFSVLADVARMETENLSERIKSGQAEALRKGKKLGRKKGSAKDPQQLLDKYPGVVKDLKAGQSIRNVAAIRDVSAKTVQKVKSLLDGKQGNQAG